MTARSATDSELLRKALRLAARGRYRVSPNPMVGAVVARDGEVVGEGWHRAYGGPHAETVALERAGAGARGATLYVTLEPCAHRGNTGPCAEAVVRAGITRVVACHGDPDPRNAGAGFRRLREAGIAVEVGLLAAEAAELNLAFLVSHVLDRPAVTLKWAMSLDGRIATASGESQWISSPAGRRWALAQRESHDAVLVGSGTALADDPRLDRRLGRAAGPGLRVVLDRRLRLPPAARMLSIPGPVLVYTAAGGPGENGAGTGPRGKPAGEPGSDTGPGDGPDPGRRSGAARALERAGAEVVPLERVEPGAVLADLHRRGVRSVLVEGGAGVAAAFAREGFFDRVAVGCAPLLIGGSEAPGPLGGEGVAALGNAPRLDRLRIRRRGPDIVLTGLRQGCLPDLLRSVAGSS
ncbi:MAG: bifunctional diaminohydroxyphosphoribosylaminopyrimidine deaminase/5-amino-6-(5-phosphoribosylamino)uracil reductase RibD, partial [Thermoanaerobaculia bacterium]